MVKRDDTVIDYDDTFTDLESDVNADGSFAPDVYKGKPENQFQRRKYTCIDCNGTGVWQGGRQNRYGNSKCNSCHGLGYHVTAPDVREKRRVEYQNKKADVRAAAQADNIHAIGGEKGMAALAKCCEWSEFARSVHDQHVNGKPWSAKQIAAVNRMLEKVGIQQSEKKRAAKGQAVDLTPIKRMFDAAVEHGYKAPKYRAEGLILSRARDHSANPGALYVKDLDGQYLGKIIDNQFLHGRVMEPDIASAVRGLQIIADDPAGAAVRYGQRTGRCACCGRELTKDESIARGIGPICAERWGLTGMKMHATKEEAKAELKGLIK